MVPLVLFSSFLFALSQPIAPKGMMETRSFPISDYTITHFTKVDSGVYVGSKPKSDADFRFLRAKGVRYILEVHFLPFLDGPERAKARRDGIGFLSVPMNGSLVSPSEKHVAEALQIMRSKKYHPIYVHCVLGRDRSGLLVGLYRMYYLGVPKQQAYREMKQAGFRDSFYLSGLKRYFDKHPSSIH